jgi:hypothetical protein
LNVRPLGYEPWSEFIVITEHPRRTAPGARRRRNSPRTQASSRPPRVVVAEISVPPQLLMPTTSRHNRTRDLQVQVRLMTSWVHQGSTPAGICDPAGVEPRDWVTRVVRSCLFRRVGVARRPARRALARPRGRWRGCTSWSTRLPRCRCGPRRRGPPRNRSCARPTSGWCAAASGC